MRNQDADQQAVIVTHHNRVTTCTLNRPDKLNALNADLVEGLLQALENARTKNSQLVVFRGTGRAFCAGFDLSDLAALSDADLLYRFVPDRNPVTSDLYRTDAYLGTCSRPVLWSWRGYCCHL